MWYILEKEKVWGPQNQCSQVPGIQIHKWKYTNTQIQFGSNYEIDLTCDIFLKRWWYEAFNNNVPKWKPRKPRKQRKPRKLRKPRKHLEDTTCNGCKPVKILLNIRRYQDAKIRCAKPASKYCWRYEDTKMQRYNMQWVQASQNIAEDTKIPRCKDPTCKACK